MHVRLGLRTHKEINLQHGRSVGPAPHIPYMCCQHRESEAQMRRELREIHGLTKKDNGNVMMKFEKICTIKRNQWYQ